MFHYKTKGTCSTQIDLEIAQGVITACKIHNGCRGNTAGLARMVIGRSAAEVQALLRGVPCRGSTSCPDQLSRAIEAYLCSAASSAEPGADAGDACGNTECGDAACPYNRKE